MSVLKLKVNKSLFKRVKALTLKLFIEIKRLIEIEKALKALNV